MRSLCDPIYELDSESGLLRREDYYALGISLSEALITELQAEPLDFDAVSTFGSDNGAHLEFLTPPLTDDLLDMDSDVRPLIGLAIEDLDDQLDAKNKSTDNSNLTSDTPPFAASTLSCSANDASSGQERAKKTFTPTVPPNRSAEEQNIQQQRLEADACCEICGYRPKGDPRWFHGSMAKHRKLQHSKDPPKIYKCNYPGCSSAFKNRPDNLRQHQIEKGHFVEGEEGPSKRPSKRKKVSS